MQFSYSCQVSVSPCFKIPPQLRALMSLILLSCEKGWGKTIQMVSLPLSPKSASIQPLFTYFISMLTLFIFVSIQLIGLHVIQRRVNPQYLHYNIYSDITNGYSTHNLHLKKNGEYCNDDLVSDSYCLQQCFKNVSNLHISSITLLTLIYLRSLKTLG